MQFVLMEQDQTASGGLYAGPKRLRIRSKTIRRRWLTDSFGRDGSFHAKQLQAKCASKYAPQQPGTPGESE